MNSSSIINQNFDQEYSISEEMDFNKSFSFNNKNTNDNNNSNLDKKKDSLDEKVNLKKENLFSPFVSWNVGKINNTKQNMDNTQLFNSQINNQPHPIINNFQKNNSNNTFYYPYNIQKGFLPFNNTLISQNSSINNGQLGKITPTDFIIEFKDKNKNKLSVKINYESNSVKLDINKNNKSEECQINRTTYIKPENEIQFSKILSGEEKRTCIRLSSIPKRYSPFDVIKFIDKHLKTVPGKRIYKSIYVPLSKVIGRNIGYCFIDMVSPKFVIEFYNAFNGKYTKNLKKKFWVVFSDIQNVDVYGDDPLRKPIIFKDFTKDNN